MVEKKNRRRVTLIDKKQQAFFAGTLMLYSLLAVLFFLYLTLLSNPLFADHIEHGFFYPAALGQVLRFCLDHWVESLITFLFIAVCGLLFSHQIFGPIRRFERALAEKKKEPEEPVNCGLRRSDYFQSFSKLLEEVLNRSATAENPASVTEKPEVASNPSPQ